MAVSAVGLARRSPTCSSHEQERAGRRRRRQRHERRPGLADQGFKVILVERMRALGGLAGHSAEAWRATTSGPMCRARRAHPAHPRIEVLTQTIIVDHAACPALSRPACRWVRGCSTARSGTAPRFSPPGPSPPAAGIPAGRARGRRDAARPGRDHRRPARDG